MAETHFEFPRHLENRAAFRVRDVTDAFGFSKAKVFHLIRSGRLAAAKLDGVVLIPRRALESYLAEARPIAATALEKHR